MTPWHFSNPKNWTADNLRQLVEQGSQSLLDEVVLAGFRVVRTRRSENYMRNILADAHTAIAEYDAAGWLDNPRLAHSDPEAPQEHLRSVLWRINVDADDQGRGVGRFAVDRLLAEARERGMEVSDEMPDSEVWQLIFVPGFSTADVVTDVSGRGVGMDVVKTKISALGGVVQVSSVKGEGTTITIRLPLTLAIIQTLIVQLGEDVFAIPTGYIEQTISVARNEIKKLRNQEVAILRGEVIPLIRLQDFLGVPKAKNEEFDELDVVVVRNGERKLGCVVDSLVRQQDVVIKSLGSYLGNIAGIAGATILGNGKIALILDMRAVA